LFAWSYLNDQFKCIGGDIGWTGVIARGIILDAALSRPLNPNIIK